MPPPFEAKSGAEGELKAFYRTCHKTSERLLELFAMALDVRSRAIPIAQQKRVLISSFLTSISGRRTRLERTPRRP